MGTSIITPGQGPENLFKRAAKELVARARTFGEKIDTAEQFTAVSALFNDIAGAIKKTEAHYDPKIADARVPYNNLLAEKKGIMDVLEPMKKDLGNKMSAYDRAARQIAVAREQALERERKAEADRQLQEQREAEEERRIEQAEQLQAAGKSEEAMKLLEEPITVEEKPTFAPATTVKPAITTAPGVSGRKKWKARLNPTGSGIEFPNPVPEELQVKAKLELIKAVAEGKVPHLALDVNDKFINSQGNSMKKLLQYPGVEAYEDTSWAGRG